jgi:tetratricopeptide (TPR) repeat protein
LKKKFPVYEETTDNPLRDKVLHEFGRLAEKSTKAPLLDSVFYVSLSLPMTGIEELMYQIISGDLSKKLEISAAAMKTIAAQTQQAVVQPSPVHAVQAPAQPPPHKAPAHQAVAPKAPVQQPPAKVHEAPPQQPQPPVAAATQLPDPETEPGIGLLSSKRYEEAVEYYKNKAKKNPKDPEGWFGLSACLFLTGEIKKCTLYYNRCLDITPGFDIIGRLIILSNNDLKKLAGLAENLLTLELNKEAQKYIDYLQDKLPPEEIEHLINLQKKSL